MGLHMSDQVNGSAADDDKIELKPISAAEQKKLLTAIDTISDKLAKNAEVRSKLKAEEKGVLAAIFSAIGNKKFRLSDGSIVSVMRRRPKGGGDHVFVLRGKSEDEITDFGS